MPSNLRALPARRSSASSREAPANQSLRLASFSGTRARGFTREHRTGSNGRFAFEGVPPGGPYELRAFALGLDPARSARTFTLALGDRVAIDLALPEEATSVLPTVGVRTDPHRDEGGPSFAMPDELVHGLPLLSRNFVGLFATIPQAINSRGTYSVSGQLPALNAIQIDGGIASDVYGVTRTPGANAGAKSISLEALDQIQVLVARLDVRHGAFTGALINGITRSGTNRWQGSVFTSVQDQVLVGKDTAGTRASGFDFLQYGATIGGPTIRDKLHLFVAADLQRRRTPYIGPDARDSATGHQLGDVDARRGCLPHRLRVRSRGTGAARAQSARSIRVRKGDLAAVEPPSCRAVAQLGGRVG